MTNDNRFGLPVSLVEALRDDCSPTAAALADLLERGDAPARASSAPTKPVRHWQAVLTGLALSASIGAQSYAATPSLQGRWTMATEKSQFVEGVTGPAPDAATLVVTHDDPARLTYALVETRDGLEVARADYDISFAGSGSTSAMDHVRMQVVGAREHGGGVVIRAPAVRGIQASIRLRRTGPNSALLEHDVSDAAGAMRLETISLVRGQDR